MLSQPEIIALMRENEAFATAPEERLQQLAEGFTERHCTIGEVLIEQGTKGGVLFLVIDGEFGVFIREREGSPATDPEGPQVATLGRSNIVGEIGAVSGIPATATVRALSDGHVLVLDEKLFQELMYHSPRLAESVLRSLTRYMGKP